LYRGLGERAGPFLSRQDVGAINESGITSDLPHALIEPPEKCLERENQKQAEQKWREQQAREAQRLAASCDELAGNPIGQPMHFCSGVDMPDL
jgi:hypothetical protein